MIEARGLTKRYGEKTAVNDLTFTVRAGAVTGFLGPNGAGKSTTMRLILGLDRPSAGTVTVDGHRYVDDPAPLRAVGALLEARAIHPGRSARNHLRALAATHAIPDRRVEEVLELVGLSDVARTRIGTFSLGMGQRLGIATALLGDPQTVILDEPVNGLDPEGIRWVRGLLRGLAAEGRTVLVSSHLMAEMALTAEHVLVIGRGRLVADLPTGELIGRTAGAVLVRSPQPGDIAAQVRQAGGSVEETDNGALRISGLTAAQVGELAFEAGLRLHELTTEPASLEEAFMELTRDALDYPAVATAAASAA